MGLQFSLDESQRQAMLLALALLALERPGWDAFLSEIAVKLNGLDLFLELKRIHGAGDASSSKPTGVFRMLGEDPNAE